MFRLVGNWTNFWIFPLDWLWFQEAGYHFEYWERDWRYPRPATSWWQGEEEGRWTTRQVEPGGDGGVRGGRDIFLLRSQEGVEHIQFYKKHLIWLLRRFVQWSKHWQLIASESERESGQWAWLTRRQTLGSDESFNDITFTFQYCSFSFFCDFRHCLTRNRWVWKCSC